MASASAAGWQSQPDDADFNLIVEYYEAVVAACLASRALSTLEEAVAWFVAPVDA